MVQIASEHINKQINNLMTAVTTVDIGTAVFLRIL